MSPEKLTNPFSSLTVEQGLVRNIGVSNWNCQGLRDLVSYAKIKPAVLQVHAQLKMLSTRVHIGADIQVVGEGRTTECFLQ